MFGKRKEVAEWVEGLLAGKRNGPLLRYYPKLSLPFSLRALPDPRALRGDDPPIGVICDLLEPLQPADAAGYVIGVLPKLSGSARWHATSLLLAIGTPACHDAVAANLKSGDAESDKRNMNFIWHALRRWEKRRKGTGSLFDGILADLKGGNVEWPDYHLSMLLWLDPQRAGELLVAPEWLSATAPYTHAILWAFHETRTRMPGDALLPLLPALRKYKSERLEHGHDAYGVGLMVLARSAPGLARPLIDSELRDQSSPGRHWGACEAMAILHGVEDARQVVLRKRVGRGRRDGFDRLSKENQYHLVAFDVDAEVCNGGWSQYFCNSSGRRAHLAPEALLAIGAPKAADLARQALAALADAGGRAPYETLYDRLCAMPTSERLGGLTTAYYEREEGDILSLLKLYAAKHAKQFR